MDITIFYLALFYGVAVSVIGYRVLQLVLPIFYAQASRFITYPLLVQRSRWRSPTRLQAILSFVFISGNLSVLLYPFSPLPEARSIQKRAALAALINLLPVLVGRQILSLSTLPYISASSLELVHHTLSITIYVESLIHSIIVLSTKPSHNQSLVSGYIVGSPGMCICVDKYAKRE